MWKFFDIQLLAWLAQRESMRFVNFCFVLLTGPTFEPCRRQDSLKRDKINLNLRFDFKSWKNVTLRDWSRNLQAEIEACFSLDKRSNLNKWVLQALMPRSTSSHFTQLWQSEPKKRMKEDMKKKRAWEEKNKWKFTCPGLHFKSDLRHITAISKLRIVGPVNMFSCRENKTD